MSNIRENVKLKFTEDGEDGEPIFPDFEEIKNPDLLEIVDLCLNGIFTDGEHHKNFYLLEVLKQIILKEHHEYLDNNSISAITSFVSDMNKHEETAKQIEKFRFLMLSLHKKEDIKQFIEGFN